MTGSADQTVLITGAARRIGRGLAEALASDGWNIAIHYYGSSEDADSLAGQLSKTGVTAETFSADLSDVGQSERLLDSATKSIGPISALINNASLFEEESWDDVTPDSWSQHLSINLHAPFILSQRFAKALPDTLNGSIVNIIDQRVFNLTPNFVSYTVSKSGLWTLTRTLAMALAPRIRVNAVGPGPTLPNARQTEQSFQNQVDGTPLARKVEVSDIANAVSYLLNAKSVTGQMIAVDSGEHMGWSQPVEGQTYDG